MLLLPGLCREANDKMIAAVRLPEENVACMEQRLMCSGTVFLVFSLITGVAYTAA